MAVKYVRWSSGADGNDGTSWTDVGGGVGPWKSLKTRTGGSLSAGDEIRYEKSPAPGSIGSCTWTNDDDTITIPSGLVKIVDDCEATWTWVDSNVTQSATTSGRKLGSYNLQFAVGTGAPTGLLAYKTLSSTDFSGFSALTFYGKGATGTTDIPAGTFRLALCTDTVGATVDRYVDIPAIEVSGGNFWHTFAIDAGGAFSATIQSVALYAPSGVGGVAYSLGLDNIVACKASSNSDALSLVTPIGKNGSGEEGLWYPIKGFTSDTTLDLDPNSKIAGSASTLGLYRGTSESCTTYICRPYIRTTGNSTNTDIEHAAGVNGLSYKGGYSDATTRDGVTWYHIEGIGSLFGSVAQTDLSWSFMGVSGGNYFIYLANTSARRWVVEDCHTCGTNAAAFSIGNPCASSSAIRRCRIVGQGGNQLTCPRIVDDLIIWAGLYGLGSTDGRFLNCVGIQNSGTGSTGMFTLGPGTIADGCTTRHCTYGVGPLGTAKGVAIVRNHTFDSCGTNVFCTGTIPVEVWVQDYAGSAGTHYCYIGVLDTTAVIIQNEGTVRHTASGISWKVNMPTTATSPGGYANAHWHQLGILAVKANLLVTVELWVRRTNTAAVIGILVPEGYVDGISADVTDEITEAIDTWEKLSLTFTPTENGTVPVYVYFYGDGTARTAYFDDFSATQASS